MFFYSTNSLASTFAVALGKGEWLSIKCDSNKFGCLNTKLAITWPVLEIYPRLLYQTGGFRGRLVMMSFKFAADQPQLP